jgi:hypothetical protein
VVLPLELVEPMTCPVRIPPPATSIDMAWGQVISTGLRNASLCTFLSIDAGGATEFSSDDEQNFSIQPLIVEVFDEGSHGLVVDREANASVFKQVTIDGV